MKYEEEMLKEEKERKEKEDKVDIRYAYRYPVYMSSTSLSSSKKRRYKIVRKKIKRPTDEEN